MSDLSPILIDLRDDETLIQIETPTAAANPINLLIANGETAGANNPFDRLQQFADNFNDPFEIVSAQADNVFHSTTTTTVADGDAALPPSKLIRHETYDLVPDGGEQQTTHRPTQHLLQRNHSDPNAVVAAKSPKAPNLRSNSADILSYKRNQLLKLSLANSSFGSPRQRAAAAAAGNGSPSIRLVGASGEELDVSTLNEDQITDLLATSMPMLLDTDDDDDNDDDVKNATVKSPVPPPTEYEPEIIIKTEHQPAKSSAANRLKLIENFEKHKRVMNESKKQIPSPPPIANDNDNDDDVDTTDEAIESFGFYLTGLLQLVRQQPKRDDRIDEAIQLIQRLCVVLRVEVPQRKLGAHLAPAPIVREGTFNMESAPNEQQPQALSPPIQTPSPPALQTSPPCEDGHNSTSVANKIAFKSRRSSSLSLPQKPAEVARALANIDQQRRRCISNAPDNLGTPAINRRRSVAVAPPTAVVAAAAIATTTTAASRKSAMPFPTPTKPAIQKLKIRSHDVVGKPMAACGPIRAKHDGVVAAAVATPAACSTPIYRRAPIAGLPVTPQRRGNVALHPPADAPNGRVRLGSISATPNPKSSSSLLVPALGRRRTLSDFKADPLTAGKPKGSTTAMTSNLKRVRTGD